MEFILIFTNFERLARYQRHKLSWKPHEEQIKSIPTSGGNMFFILYDNLSNFEELLARLLEKNNKTYIIYHSGTDRSIVGKIEAHLKQNNIPFEKPVESHHPNPQFYGRLKTIDLYQDDGEKMETVFDEIKQLLTGDPVLEEKLELLHACLDKKYTIPKELNKLLELLNKDDEKLRIARAIDEYNENDKTTLDGLRKFRDELLGEHE